MLFDGSDCGLRTVRLQGRRTDCATCGTEAAAKDAGSESNLVQNDACMSLKVLHADRRMGCNDFASLYAAGTEKFLLLDVRPALEYGICSLQGFVNVPWVKRLSRSGDDGLEDVIAMLKAASKVVSF